MVALGFIVHSFITWLVLQVMRCNHLTAGNLPSAFPSSLWAIVRHFTSTNGVSSITCCYYLKQSIVFSRFFFFQEFKKNKKPQNQTTCVFTHMFIRACPIIFPLPFKKTLSPIPSRVSLEGVNSFDFYFLFLTNSLLGFHFGKKKIHG